MQALRGRVAIITGATGGIGSAIAERFSAEGAACVLSGRRPHWSGPRESVYLPGDLGDEQYARSLVGVAQEAFGGVDVLVNAHGVDLHGSLTDVDLDVARRVIEGNFIGVLISMKHAIPAMLARGGGSIVNIGSRLGQVSIPGQAIYGATKAAVSQLTRGAAIDWAPQRIRANCVAPGLTETQMISTWVADQPDPAGFRDRLVASVPLRRMASPAEIAAATLFLASDEASHITGITLAVDGGYTAQ